MSRSSLRRSARTGLLAIVLAALAGTMAVPANAATGTLAPKPGQSHSGAWTTLPGNGSGGASLVFSVPSHSSTFYSGIELAPTANTTSTVRARVKLTSTGSPTLSVSKVVSGKEEVFNGPTLPATFRAGQKVRLEVQPSTTKDVTLKVRAWVDGTTAPAWQYTKAVTGVAAPTTVRARPWTYLSGNAASAVNTAYTSSVGVTAATNTVTAPVVKPTPNASNTGVPAGTTLKKHVGDLVITTPGARYDALDISGFVVVKAPDVKITRSLIRGGVKTGNRGLVTVDHADAKRFVIEDSTIRPDNPSVWYDGIKGSNFTATRVNVWGTVDNIKVHGNDVLVQDSYLHDSSYFASDPNQGGGPTHNDAVQVLGGSNIVLRNNSLSGAKNAAVQVTQGFAPVVGLVMEKNLFAGGECNIKLNHKGKANTLAKVVVKDNRFNASGTLHSGTCPILATGATVLEQSGNVYAGTTNPIKVRIYG